MSRHSDKKPAGRHDAGSSARSSDALARVFAALGDPTRLKLVAVLCAGGAFSIAQLTANTEMTRQGVTKHLQVLAEAGGVRAAKSRRGRPGPRHPAPLAP